MKDPHCGEDADDAAAKEQGDTSPAAVGPPGAVPEPSVAPLLASRDDDLRQVARALLDAWDNNVSPDNEVLGTMNGPVTALRAALAKRASISTSAEALRPRKDTKQAQVLALLRRSEGASGPQIAGATGWAPHTVRGFLAGLSKKGITVNVLERVRQLGSNKQGVQGSYTVYRLAVDERV